MAFIKYSRKKNPEKVLYVANSQITMEEDKKMEGKKVTWEKHSLVF